MDDVTITIGSHELRLVEGDITTLDVDAIVNPANSGLVLGGGVAGIIRRKGGPSIQRECDAIGGCPVGGAVITGAGDLPQRHVIHAVGPRMGEGDEDAKLAGAVESVIDVALRQGISSVAIPAISTGIFGFPMARAAHVMLDTLRDTLRRNDGRLVVVVCLYGSEAYGVFRDVLVK